MSGTASVATHRHPHAFRLLSYRSRANPQNIEHIWNSRDGFIPLEIKMADGSLGRYVQLIDEPYLPEHRPAVGERIVVTMTVPHARSLASERASELWKDRGPFGRSSQLTFRSELEVVSWVFDNLLMDVVDGAPWIETVTDVLAEQRGWS